MQPVKHCWPDLAIFGGDPAFSEKLYVGRPNIGNRERFLERIGDVLSRRWLSNNGCCVQELERRISELLGVRHCIAVCNATVALEIAAQSLGFTGEVIVPSFTFVATAHALQWLGLTPVFCDVDRRTHNIDPCQIEALITPRTSGIVGVHLWGRPCEVEALTRITENHGLSLIFDAAHAFGCSHKGRMIGNFGSLEVFSFHATKFFNTFEGGAIVTNDDALAAKVRAMKNFGFCGQEETITVGTNGKMSEVSAAMGLTGLESLEEFVAINRRNYQRYQAELADVPGICFMTFDERERHNYQYIVLEVDEALAQISRDQLLQILHAENIMARRYFYPGCHRVEPYRSQLPRSESLLPVTENLANRVLVLPSGTAVTVGDVQRICEIVRLAVREHQEIGEELLRRSAQVGR
jgi:dTDP-4-amino-4,6-dideoxygalactose transaminase